MLMDVSECDSCMSMRSHSMSVQLDAFDHKQQIPTETALKLGDESANTILVGARAFKYGT